MSPIEVIDYIAGHDSRKAAQAHNDITLTTEYELGSFTIEASQTLSQFSLSIA